jgi:nucleoid-associated protein YgaU
MYEQDSAGQQQPAQYPAAGIQAPDAATGTAGGTGTAAPAFIAGGAVAAEQPGMSHSISDNEYFLEGQRLFQTAEETYRYGDYDTAFLLAYDAIFYAQLSDGFVTQQMKIKAINDAIASARTRLDWAASTGVSDQHPEEYGEAEGWYEKSVADRSDEEWDSAYYAAHQVVDLLAFMQVPDIKPPEAARQPDTRPSGTAPASTGPSDARQPGTAPAGTSPAGGGAPDTRSANTTPTDGAALPATYTVRTWANSRDCFWTIAGRPGVYNDPHRWRTLYNANRSKLPDPDNPNLIEPGTVLDIPSLRGELRQGEWDPGKTYSPLR